MSIKVGNVIKNKSCLHVITQITNGIVSDTEKLEDYIIKNSVVQEDGEWKTLKEVIERYGCYRESGEGMIGLCEVCTVKITLMDEHFYNGNQLLCKECVKTVIPKREGK